jgi:enoyl-CoA hydratase
VSGQETIFGKDGRCGRILLNRPKVLNALSPTQFGTLDAQLAAWQRDDGVAAVVIEGEGERAFSAGGDIRATYDAWKRGDHAGNRGLFRAEYRLDRRIHYYPKPYVAILDGIVMGGGAGVSINGGFRVATERTQFAMPETGIGFFPDVGATHFLNRCPGRIGLYLGLTGARIGPADALWAGIATHFVPVAGLDALRAGLAEAAGAADAAGAVAEVLAAAHRDPGPGLLAEHRVAIDTCFGAGRRVADIRTALSADPWGASVAEDLTAKAPFALAVAHRQLTGGQGMAFDEAIRREFRLACRFIAGHDFFEGIRAQVVDKDRSPRWDPETLAEVDALAVDACFAPLPAGEELEFED